MDTAIRFENRGVRGLSVGLPNDVIAAAVPGPRNFKGKPMGPKGGIRNNVVHSSKKGIKNYPHYSPKGGVLIEGMTVWKGGIGIFAKNGYNYVNDSPFFEDGKNGRSTQRYTVRGATLIGLSTPLYTINGPTKMHCEKSVIAATPPADLYPQAAADAYTGKEWKVKYQIAQEGKHLPREKDKWAITLDDETLERARANGFRTRAELEAEGVPFTTWGYPNVGGKRSPWVVGGKLPAVKYIGNVNKFYQRAMCGSRGKQPPPCSRPAFVFPRPKDDGDDEVEDIVAEMADIDLEEDTAEENRRLLQDHLMDDVHYEH